MSTSDATWKTFARAPSASLAAIFDGPAMTKLGSLPGASGTAPAGAAPPMAQGEKTTPRAVEITTQDTCYNLDAATQESVREKVHALCGTSSYPGTSPMTMRASDTYKVSTEPYRVISQNPGVHCLLVFLCVPNGQEDSTAVGERAQAALYFPNGMVRGVWVPKVRYFVFKGTVFEGVLTSNDPFRQGTGFQIYDTVCWAGSDVSKKIYTERISHAKAVCGFLDTPAGTSTERSSAGRPPPLACGDGSARACAWVKVKETVEPHDFPDFHASEVDRLINGGGRHVTGLLYVPEKKPFMKGKVQRFMFHLPYTPINIMIALADPAPNTLLPPPSAHHHYAGVRHLHL